MIRNDTIWGTVKCGIAECGMAIGLGLDLGPGVRVRVMAGHGLRSGLGSYFAAVLHNFLQFYTFRIAQMRNGYGGKTRG